MRRAAVLLIVAVAILSLTIIGVSRGTRTTTAGTPAPVATTTTATPAAVSPPQESTFTGTVAETMDSGGYTYVRLQNGKDDVWIAARPFPTKPGDRLTVALEMPMENFESRTLGRTFPLIYFVSGVMRDGQRVDGAAGPAASGGSGMPGHPPASVPTSAELIAPAPGGTAIADVWAERTALAGHEVTVRGKVVKVNDQIMGRNWIHLQDGSGAAADRTNDLTITTAEVVKVGDVITIKGVLTIDKDFGAGYAYGAIVEDGRVIK